MDVYEQTSDEVYLLKKGIKAKIQRVKDNRKKADDEERQLNFEIVADRERVEELEYGIKEEKPVKNL